MQIFHGPLRERQQEKFHFLMVKQDVSQLLVNIYSVSEIHTQTHTPTHVKEAQSPLGHEGAFSLMTGFRNLYMN